MEFLFEVIATIILLAFFVVIFIGMAIYPSQASIEALQDHWREVNRQGEELLKNLKGSGWELEDVASLPELQRRSFVEQLDLDYDLITEFIDVYCNDEEHYMEVTSKVHIQWMPDIKWSEYRATRQALRQVPKNVWTMLPK